MSIIHGPAFKSETLTLAEIWRCCIYNKMVHLSLCLIIVVKDSVKQISKKGQMKSKGGKLDYQGIEDAQATRSS